MTKQAILSLIDAYGRQAAIGKIADYIYRQGCVSQAQAERQAEYLVRKAEEEDGKM
jgi:hypothetical protein